MMRKTFNQLTCLYQLWRLIAVSAIWTFLASGARARASAVCADMVADPESMEEPYQACVCDEGRWGKEGKEVFKREAEQRRELEKRSRSTGGPPRNDVGDRES